MLLLLILHFILVFDVRGSFVDEAEDRTAECILDVYLQFSLFGNDEIVQGRQSHRSSFRV